MIFKTIFRSILIGLITLGFILYYFGFVISGVISVITLLIALYFYIIFFDKSKFKNVLITIFFSIFIVFLIVGVLIELFYSDIKGEKLINQYDSLIEKYTNDLMTEHFPISQSEIPNNSTLYYRGKVLQGGGNFFLKSVYEKEDFKNKIEQYSINPIEVEKLSINIKEFINFNLINDNIENYVVYTLYAKPYKEDNWNHGRISGLAFNEVDNTIIYWAEFW